MIIGRLGILDAKKVMRNGLISAPADASAFFSLRLGSLEHEVFAAIFLDAQNRVIEYIELFRGTLTQTSVYPREMVKTSLRLGCAAAVIFALSFTPPGCPSRRAPMRTDQSAEGCARPGGRARAGSRRRRWRGVGNPSLNAACCSRCQPGEKPGKRPLRAFCPVVLTTVFPAGKSGIKTYLLITVESGKIRPFWTNNYREALMEASIARSTTNTAVLERLSAVRATLHLIEKTRLTRPR